MSVFRDVTITWGGRDYVVTPSNRLLRRIEQEVSLTKMQVKLARGEPSVSAMSYVLAELLKSAGAVVTEDEVMQAFAHSDADEAVAMANAISDAITPIAPPGKKT